MQTTIPFPFNNSATSVFNMWPTRPTEMSKFSFDQLFEFLFNSRKYLWFIGVPGRVEIAEYLYEYWWHVLPSKVANKVEEVLLGTGKYIKS